MILEINNRLGQRLDRQYLEKVAVITFKNCALKKRKISLAIIGNAEMKKLNRSYRHKDRVTDILSFAYDSADIQNKLPMSDYLGEILICYPRAVKQTEQKKTSIKAELTLLLVHGILHLAGYDHRGKIDFEMMEKKTQQTLSKLKK